MNSSYLRPGVLAAVIVGIGLVGALGIVGCSGSSDNPTSPTNTNATPVDIAPPIPGLGQPAMSDIEISFTSQSLVSDTVRDTILLADYVPTEWDGVTDTISDTLMVVWRARERILDTTVTLDQSSGGTVSVVLPAGAYVISPSVDGTLGEFYSAHETLITSDGVTPIVFRPEFSLVDFGSVSGLVVSCATMAVIGNSVRIELSDESLLGGKDVFYSDTNGQFTMPYIPAGAVEMTMTAMGASATLFAEKDTVLILADGQNVSVTICLQPL